MTGSSPDLRMDYRDEKTKLIRREFNSSMRHLRPHGSDAILTPSWRLNMKPRIGLPALVFSVLVAPLCSYAQWQLDGVPVSATLDTQSTPVLVSDGSGGAVIAWVDGRNGNFDIYAQRVDASGVALWTVDGVALCTAPNDQYNAAIVSDGFGGAIVTWQDQRTGSYFDIYAQRIDASGVTLWAADGVPLCTAGLDQGTPIIASDGSGGAIIAWVDDRSGNYDIYARRVDATGVPQWTADGVALCTVTNDQATPRLVPDGSGGAIVTWRDGRNDQLLDIYAQRIDASGIPQWTADGVALCVALGDQRYPAIVSDGSGGAIVAWEDDRNGSFDIYAQRVTATGVPQWTADGVGLCSASGNQQNPDLVSDGSGGAIVAWADYRDAPGGPDVYVQRVNALSAPQWTSDGVALSDQYGVYEVSLSIVSDGSGGAIVAWRDNRDDPDYDIYARRVAAAGVPRWTGYGVPVCTAPGTNGAPMIAPDGSGGIIATWYDGRSSTTYDVYAQRIEGRYGYWGRPEPVVTSVDDVPGDQGGKVKVNWTASGRDVLDMRTITHYSVWRATDPVAAGIALAGNPSLLVGPGEVGAEFSGPGYRVEHTSDGDYYWEFVGSQSAQYFDGYRFSADTGADSTSQGTMAHYFQVLSHAADDFVFWPSNAMSGHSVDNLAPASPPWLTAERVGPDVHLTWSPITAFDLRDYAVYRATKSAVDPVPINFLSHVADTLLIDAGAPLETLYYVVTAVDIHENESAPSNEASVSTGTGVEGDAPAIRRLTVLPNHPNPFRRTTAFQIGLSGPSTISIDVYDVIGRRVRSLELPESSAGWQQVPFDGADDSGRPLVSGVYYYRVTANGATLTRKMVIAR
jgi:hypothetical protein